MNNYIRYRRYIARLIRCTLMVLFMHYSIGAKAQTEVVNITLDEPTYRTHSYVAKEYVDLAEGFSYSASGSYYFHAKADENLVVLEDNGDIHGGSDGGVVGSINGQFSVTPTGGASYTMPITVSPGTAGMTPELAITYNSQGGDGLLGIGFGLSGLSLITRCPSTYFHDGKIDGVDFDADDRFMLDGQRLMVDAGFTYGAENATYRTESNSFSKIVSGGMEGLGPETFIVYTKSGLKKYYGYSTDSQLKLASGDGVMFWLLTKIEDTKGNTIEYEYDKEDQIYFEFRIKSIKYTSNSSLGLSAYNKVVFTYADRPDTLQSYIYGVKSMITKILTKIECKNSDQTYRTYSLTYENFGAANRSHLTQIDESNNYGESFNPTRFNWQNDDIVYPNYRCYNQMGVNKYSEAYPADFKGNGKHEIFVANDHDQNGTFDNCGFWYAAWENWGGIPGFYFHSASIDKPDLPAHAKGFFTGDFNGDGRSDIMVSTHATGVGTQIYLWLSEGNRFEQNSYIITHTDVDGVVVGDFDGDGMTECMVHRDVGYPDTYIYGGWYDSSGNFNYGNKYTIFTSSWTSKVDPIDFDGDGKTDLAIGYNESLRILRFNLQKPSQAVTSILLTDFCIDHDYKYGDFNGDGKTDVLVYGALGMISTTNWRILLSNGKNYETHIIDSKTGSTAYTSWCRFNMGDFNGDGKTDFFMNNISGSIPSNDNLKYYYFSNSNGTDFDKAGGSNGMFANEHHQFYIADFDGNGYAELFTKSTDDSYNYCWTLYNVDNNYSLIKKKKNDLLLSITSGLDNEISINYEPLTDNTVYSQTSDPNYPISSYIGASDVVSEVITSDGIGGNNSITYKYEDAHAHRLGKGLLGFMKTIAYDVESDISTISKYELNSTYYYLSLKETETRVGNTETGQLISKVTYTNEARDDGQGVYFPWISKAVEKKYERGSSTPFSTVTSNFGPYDTYGNILESSMEYEDGYTISTVNTYDNIVDTKWMLGRLRSATVTKHAPAPKQDIIRKSEFEYYADDGLLKLEKVEPDLPDEPGELDYCVETLYTYDGYGNVITKTTTERRTGKALTTGYMYDDATHRFIKQQTNPAGHIETMTYNPFSGNMITHTDPNGLITTFRYDGFGRLKKTTTPGNIQSLTERRWCIDNTADKPDGAVYYIYSQTSGNEPVIEFYDTLGRVIRTKSIGLNGEKILADKIYNKLGQVDKVYLPYIAGNRGNYTKYYYDVFGRVDSETLPDGHSVDYEYNGFTSEVTNQKGIRRAKTVNARGQLVSSEGFGCSDGCELNDKLTYDYDAAGNLIETKFENSEKGFTITMEYDIMGNQTLLDDPDLGEISYEYNAFGEMTKQTKGTNVTTFTYDELGRVKTRTEPDGVTTSTTTWTYDDGAKEKGKLSRIDMTNGDYEEYEYDDLGRVIKKTQKTGTETFVFENTYDNFSRLKQMDYPSDFALEYTYNTYGYMSQVKKAGGGDVYWQAGTANAKGQTLDYYTGNGKIHTVNSYYDNTGLIKTIQTSGLQSLYYEYDVLGNLELRQDVLKNQKEEFEYDAYNRLHFIYYNGSSSPTETINYDILGNIQSRTGVGTYHYDDATGRKHAVTSVDGTLLNTPYTEVQNTYYTSFDKLHIIRYNYDDFEMEYFYSASRERVKVQTKMEGTLTATKYYAGGGMFEKEVDEVTGTYKEIHYISSPDGVIALYTKESTGSSETRYMLKDNLGSVYCYTDENKTSPVYLSFDAWGNRRNPANWSQLYPAGGYPTTRGFTGHEHLDMFQVINMNGRIYDPLIGRFLSPDPFVQMPDNLQGLNRYSYCLNNPLSLVDPSGYMSEELASIISAAVQITVAGFAAPLGMIASSALGGFTGGFTNTMLVGGDLTQALKAGSVNSLWSVAGALSSNIVGTISHNDAVSRAVLHGLASGALAEARGGSFGPAFMSGYFSTSYEGSFSKYGKVGEVFGAAIVGGTASKLGGGKFANGAVTGAYTLIFNNWYHTPDAPAPTIQRFIAMYYRFSKMIWVPELGKIPNPFYMAEAISDDVGVSLVGAEADAGLIFILAGRDRGKIRPLTELAGGGGTDVGVQGEVSRIDYTGPSERFSLKLATGPRNKIYAGRDVLPEYCISMGLAFAWSQQAGNYYLYSYVVSASFGASLFEPYSFGYNYGKIKTY
ncbi:MAG: VCBS repeat-containing protein [Bacteroidales bacterium]|nr:VCBS repeat-containing protein [Bacteroidales bacterium]